jgi:hypothetical protein
MQTNRKQIGLLLILVGLLLLILIIYFGFSKKTPTVVPTGPTGPSTTTGQIPSGPSTGTTTPGDRPTNYLKYDLSQEAPHVTNATDLEKIGMSLAERFGSYSNQSDYSNFTDLKIFMTDNMKAWVDTYIIDLKKNSVAGAGYSGQETKALTAKTTSFDDKAGTALVIVTVERSASTDQIGGGTPEIAKLDLTFKKINNDWLMDKAYWEK